MRNSISVFLFVCCAVAQDIPHNRVTFSGGWTREVGGFSFPKATAPGIGFSYGYRFLRYMEGETGLFMAFDPTGDICSHLGCIDVQDRYHWIPFGIRFVAPPYLGRIEFSGGGGGLYEKYTVANPFPGGGPVPLHGWGGYFVGSAAVALDHGRRFWLGATPRLFMANPAYTRDRWFQISGEFSVRFR